MIRPSRSLLAAILLILAGCAGLGTLARMEEPTVDVTGLKLLGTTLSGADVLVQFRVDNPNDVGLVLDGIGYKLRLNGQPLLDGRYDQRTEIAASGRTAVEMPVTIRFDDLLRAIRTLGDPKNPNYERDADLRFAVPALGEPTVPSTQAAQAP